MVALGFQRVKSAETLEGADLQVAKNRRASHAALQTGDGQLGSDPL